MFENTDLNGAVRERFLLVGIDTGEGDIGESLDELAELADTAGAEAVARVIQARTEPHPISYLGKGKIAEVAGYLSALEADGILCDDELTPTQQRTLEQELGAKVIDRTLLILDIFAAHAVTREGRLQVELAQLRYRAARLTGRGTALSRLGGGIGTRGPGESKLETDRRRIHERIGRLKQELKQVRLHREVNRRQRERRQTVTAAIVGYTNAGKSTLLNALSGADVPAEDKLFATLDPTTRLVRLPAGQEILLTDTVGFIRKLPHHLIEAFGSTLEEAGYADILLHVVNAADPAAEHQMDVVYDTLNGLGITGRTVITLFNKTDLLPAVHPVLRDPRADDALEISVLSGKGLDDVRITLANLLREKGCYIDRVFPYEEAGRIAQIRKEGRILTEEYTDEGIHIIACVPEKYR